MEPMNRREAIRRMAWIGGGIVSVSTVVGVLGGVRARRRTGWRPRVLSGDQAETLEHLVELIIPTTDTPGARDAGVPAFIDEMLTDWYTLPERDRFLEGLDGIEARARREYGSAFADLDRDAQAALLGQVAAESQLEEVTELEVEAPAAWRALDGRSKPPMPEAGQRQVISLRIQPFYRMLKELTLVGYYTSEIGASQELQYVHTPGRYDGCIPIEELGRAWS